MITLLGREMEVLQYDTYSQESLAGSPSKPETTVAPTCLSQRDHTGQGFLAGIYQDKDLIVPHISVFIVNISI